MNNVPVQMAEWLASLPDKYCGKLYATIEHPRPDPAEPPERWRRLWWRAKRVMPPVLTEHEVPIRGQVCDGKDHRSSVHTALLYNNFPNHGKGFTYVSWRAVPDNPKAHDRATSGAIENPRPYSGIAYSEV